MNINSLKTKNNQIIALVVSLILTTIIGFYAGRYYERKTFQERFTQMRGNIQGRQNGSGQFGGGMMREFGQRDRTN